MRASKRSELNEAIRETVADFCAAGRRFLNRDIVDTSSTSTGNCSANWAANSRGRSCSTSRAGS
jgi:hypothetical protein